MIVSLDVTIRESRRTKKRVEEKRKRDADAITRTRRLIEEKQKRFVLRRRNMRVLAA